ncbi:MAG: oligosaccharide flippase family protein [Bacteroidota bacterium]
MFKKILLHQQFQKLSIYGFGQLFNLVTPLLVVPFIVSICGEENFGRTAVGMAICFFLIVFVDFGSDIIGVREVSVNRENESKLNEIFSTTYAVKGIVLLFVLLIVSTLFFIIPFFSSDKKLFFFSLLVVIGQFINPTWFLQGIENVKLITFLNVVSKIIYLAGVFLTITKESDYVCVNLWWGLGMIISNSIVFFIILKKYKLHFNNVNKSEIYSHLKNNFSIFYSQIFVSIHQYGPVILISFFGNNLLAGQYRIVDQVIAIFKTYIILFFNFVYPKVCFLIDENKKSGLKNWLIYNGVNLVFVFIGMIIFFVFSYEIISYFNPTNRYVLSNLLQIAVFIPLTFAVSNALKQLILAFNLKKEYISITIITVVLNIFTIIAILPLYKVYGVFYTLIATDIIIIFFYIFKLKKLLYK